MISIRRFRRRHGSGEAGFTVAELLVYLIVALIVVGSIYQLLIGQNRLYMKQRELLDVRGSLRAAATMLSWELRQASAASGDLYSIGTNSFAVRSIQGAGIICAEHETELRYGLWETSGEFYTTSDDSILVFAAGGPDPDDDAWKVVSIVGLWSPAGAGVATCFWGDPSIGPGKGATADTGSSWTGNVVPDTVVELAGNMDNVYMGAPLRAFRRIQYGLYQDQGRWWLGRKVGAAGSYEKLTGPLRSPTDSGLVLTYYDLAGNVTADSSLVASVEIVLRGESFGKVPKRGQAPVAQQDTLTTRVTLRG